MSHVNQLKQLGIHPGRFCCKSHLGKYCLSNRRRGRWTDLPKKTWDTPRKMERLEPKNHLQLKSGTSSEIWTIIFRFLCSSSRVFCIFKKFRVSFARVSHTQPPDSLSFQTKLLGPNSKCNILGRLDGVSPAKKNTVLKKKTSFYGEKKSVSFVFQKKTSVEILVVWWFGWNLIKNFRSFVISGVLLRFPFSSLAGAVGNLLRHNTQTPRRKLFFAAVSCDLWDLFGKFRCLQGKGSSFWNLKMDFLLFDWSRSHHHQEQHFNCYDFATPKLQVICLPSWH